LFRTFAFDCFIIWLEPAETASARSLFPSNRNPLCGRPGQFLKISTSISITYATYTPEIAGIINCYSDRARLLDKEKQRNRWEEVQGFFNMGFSLSKECANMAPKIEIQKLKRTRQKSRVDTTPRPAIARTIDCSA
jgi:hypothetical protein